MARFGEREKMHPTGFRIPGVNGPVELRNIPCDAAAALDPAV